jgi:hypothetical protein
LFIFFVVCLWLSFLRKDEIAVSFGFSESGFVERTLWACLYLFLSTHILAGGYAYYMEIRYPFSQSEAAGNYIREHKLSGINAVGALDFIVSPLSYYTGLPIYFPVSGEKSYFIKWNKKRAEGPLDLDHTMEEIKKMIRLGDERLLLIFTQKLQINVGLSKMDFEDGYMGRGIRVKHLASFAGGSIEPNETYHIYLAEKESINP